jgi:adenosylhomocysteine nucleosidase
LTVLGVVVALEIEARRLIEKSGIQGESSRPPEGIIVIISGNGAEHGRLAAEKLLEKGATALATWGSAGGLHPALLPGSLVLPENILLPSQSGFAVDTAWHRRLFNCLRDRFKLHTGPLFQSPTIITNPLEKENLFRQHNAVAVDMESAAVATVARREKVPFVAIRSVADTAGMIIPLSALGATDEHGRLRLLRLFKCLARNPEEFPLMFRLGRNFYAALNTLASVRRIAGEKLMAP